MPVELTREEEQEILPSLKKYMQEELDQEMGDLKAGLLLKYILAEIAPYAYNRGVADAERYFLEKAQDISGSCYEPPLTYWLKRKKK